jgi:DNA-binding PadR family transcriptional regulator
MAQSRKGDLSASMAILGLLIQQPDTASGLALRIAEEFHSARWSRSVAHNALPSLAKQGFVRLTEKGAKDSLDRYEVTREGVEEFRGWLRVSVAVPPALRDALHAKLALVGDEDLPWLVEAIEDQEESCRREAEKAQSRLNEARRQGQLGNRARSAMMTDEVVLWTQSANRLKRLREDLEGDDEGAEGGGGLGRVGDG